ncbi:WXG100 family type VII secretion target [Streptosporangium sp. NPDC000396]|uniref:WXG100 family type VII secretion target n=1 Tax=Streptosporangium sp. NPDC000396 TaxID=3366185 RepID=UPI0036D14E69
MSKYEEGQAMYISAAAMSAAASFIIPYARPITVLITTLISDPGEMNRCSEEWSPGADKSPDIASLRKELRQMVAEVGKSDGKVTGWKGTAHDAFLKAFEEFDTNLALFDTRRQGVSDCLTSAADLYYAGAQISMAIAGILDLLAAYVLLARATAVWGLTADGQAMGISSNLSRTMEGVTSSIRKGTWKVTGYVVGVSVFLNQESKGLVGVKPMKAEAPTFTQALNYDKASYQLISPPPDLKTPELKEPSMIPKPGW